ncbi:hypothetical protein CspeluHIS016_0115240 [Cutaneotrichosporon spelunceum]|uniref:Zn(2)-C6 fungal-type domain-containing protein n=1 Tax=Cutaneotrichosporon spelunceum TaxID=1672016 RepID=A0AAD3YAD6_9TREE|nr:hypothetical protein CspeluHIS016_0115240 [Cutaneotrichosporon spelunceum]
MDPSRVQRLLELIGSVRAIDRQSTELKRERRSQQRQKEPTVEAKACVTCRRAKTKCFNNGGACVRCMSAGRECVYAQAQKRGRRADRTIQHLLDDIESELKGEPAERSEQVHDDSEHSALHNPLGVLASAATQSNGVLPEIYGSKPEEDLLQDPILRGLVTENELERLVYFFHANMGPVFMHLDPRVHTPMLLRMNNPFLTTAVVAVASSFTSPELHDALMAHAHDQATRVFAEGRKSLEIVQAFLVLVYWAPWNDFLADKSWAYHGQALRLACEIRLDLQPDPSVAASYRYTRAFTEDEVAVLLASRKRTYHLLCVSDISMAAQSGRADTTSGHRLARRPRLSAQDLDFTAVLSIAHVFSRALHFWHAVDKENPPDSERDLFVRQWRANLETVTAGGPNQGTSIADAATILDQVACARAVGSSFAGYYAAQVRALTASATDPFDFSFLQDEPLMSFLESLNNELF